MKTDTVAQVYVGTYAKYNNGSIERDLFLDGYTMENGHVFYTY